MIIMDASTSREDVFEHQRELALSLVERLPISKEVKIGFAKGISPILKSPNIHRNKEVVKHIWNDSKNFLGMVETYPNIPIAHIVYRIFF